MTDAISEGHLVPLKSEKQQNYDLFRSPLHRIWQNVSDVSSGKMLLDLLENSPPSIISNFPQFRKVSVKISQNLGKKM